jgi:signal transduction histidine kinase
LNIVSPLRRVNSWLGLGVLIAGLELVLVMGTHFSVHWHPHARPLDSLAYTLVVLAPLALVVSPRWPAASVGLDLGLVLAYQTFGYAPGPIHLALLVALYRAAGPDHPWRTVGLGALSVLGYSVVGALSPGGLSLEGGLLGAAAVAAALGLGYAVTSQRTYTRRRREEELQRRVTEERLRIARELHDVVSHSISTINVQAGVAAHLLGERPEQARDALVLIKETSRDTLRELRGILQLLRGADEGELRSPAPGLAQLDILVDTATQSGVPTTKSIQGAARPLPPAVDLAAYRIIQESLTNVVRHAGPASAQVSVGYEPQRLVVEITDDGRGTGRHPNGNGPPRGLGIAGMRERADAVGGTVEAGPRDGRGFRVRASLPTGTES